MTTQTTATEFTVVQLSNGQCCRVEAYSPAQALAKGLVHLQQAHHPSYGQYPTRDDVEVRQGGKVVDVE